MRLTSWICFRASGFHLGFERAGYKVNSYFSEIDKHAVAVYKQQFKANMSDQLQMFKEQTSPKSTSSPLEVLAKTLVLLDHVKEWTAKDRALSLKQYGLSMNADHEILFGKMLREHSVQTMAEILRPSSKVCQHWGLSIRMAIA